MTTRRLVLLLAAALPVLVLGESASATDISITSPINFRDNRPTNPVGNTSGDLLIVGAVSITPSGAGTTGTATQGGTTLDLSFIPDTVFPNQYAASTPFNAALTGPWSINATDATGTLSVLTNSIASPQLLPLAGNVQVVGTGLRPTITWTLPDFTGFDPDRIQLRVWDLDRITFGTRRDVIFNSANLNTTTTSFVIPANLLKAGGNYAFDVIIDDFEGAFVENRSEAFSAVFRPVPEPGSLGLLVTGLAALSIVRRRLHRR